MGAALHNGCTTARNTNGNIGPQRSTTRHHTPPQQPQHKQQYTRSISTTPLLFGCSAPQQVQRYVTGAALRNGCSATQQVQRYTTGAALHNGCTTARNPNGNTGPQRSTTRHHTPPQQPQHKQQYTRSVSTTPLLFGCSATQQVQRYTTGAAPHGGCSPLTRTSLPEKHD